MATKCTLKQVLRAVKRQKGCVSRVAADLGICPDTMYSYMHRWSSVREAIQAWRRDTAYLAEGSLRDAVEAGEAWATQFALRTQGKDLGYGDQSKVEVDMPDLPQALLAALARMPDED